MPNFISRVHPLLAWQLVVICLGPIFGAFLICTVHQDRKVAWSPIPVPTRALQMRFALHDVVSLLAAALPRSFTYCEVVQ